MGSMGSLPLRRANRLWAAGLAGLLASGCAPRGLALDALSPHLEGAGSAIGFVRIGATREFQLFAWQQIGRGGLRTPLVVPEAESFELLLFLYECDDLAALGVELRTEPLDGSEPPAEPYPRFELTGRGLALRAPDRLLFATLASGESTSWRKVEWGALPVELRREVADRVPPVPGLEAPFVEAPGCRRYAFEPLEDVVVEDAVRPAFAIPSDARHAIVGLGGGEVLEVRDDGATVLLMTEPQQELQAAHVDETGRLWVVRTTRRGRRTLESVPLLALRSGSARLEVELELPELRAWTPPHREFRDASLAAPRSGAPFELFVRGGDGLFARWDGEVLTSTFTWSGGDTTRSVPLVWRAPGVAWTVAQTEDALLAYTHSRGFGALESLPLPPHTVTALVDLPGLGVAVGDRVFQLGLYRDGAGFDYLPGHEAFASPVEDRVEVLLLAPHGFIAIGDKDRLVRYYRREFDRARVETFCILNEVRPDGTLAELRHMQRAAFAGESLVLVPRDFGGRRFVSIRGRPLGSACEPAIAPTPR